MWGVGLSGKAETASMHLIRNDYFAFMAGIVSATITLANPCKPPVRVRISPVFKGVCRMGANL